MEIQQKVLVPTFSLTPTKLSIYNSVCRLVSDNSNTIEKISNSEKKHLLANLHGGEYSVNTRFHNFNLSESARKNMQHKISWLYFMAKSRYVKTISGKEIYNFKINFLTLTIPSEQKHSTSEITKIAFNQFLTELREKFNLQNYVWRIEFQGNGNVHYHIVTDSFVDYAICRKIWNRCIDKLNYVQNYHDKHKVLSLQQYCNLYSNAGKVPFDVLKKRYISGKAVNWMMPNSVDVKSVSNHKKISFYISKYFSKKGKTQNACNKLDNETNSQGLRLWYSSQSLSKLKKISNFVPCSEIDFLSMVTEIKDTFVVVHDYCTTYFYNFSSLLKKSKQIMYKVLTEYAFGTGYKPIII